MHFWVLFTLLYSLNSTAATITLYGEDHDYYRCEQQRAELAKQANDHELYLFSENVFTSETPKYILGILEHFQTKSIRNIWGLETPQSFYNSVIYGETVDALESIKNYLADENEIDLLQAQYHFNEVRLYSKKIHALDPKLYALVLEAGVSEDLNQIKPAADKI